MKKILLYIATAGLITLTGCSPLLDLNPTDAVTDKIVMTSYQYGTLYVNGFYRNLNDFGQFGTWQCYPGLTDGLTDTFKYGSRAGNVTGVHYGFANEFVYGYSGMEASSCTFFLSKWGDMYNRIRRINEFLSALDGASFDKEDIAKLEGQARFFRAFLYFELVLRHKEVIIYDKDMLKYTRNTPLSTEAQGWDFIEQDLLTAAEKLPVKWDASNSGRITKGAAYALLSRAMLYAERWEKAKKAADEVFKLGVYSLMPGDTPQAYSKCFSKSSSKGNTEAILEFCYAVGKVHHNFDYYFAPGGDETNKALALGTPTQDIVELYEKAGGGTVDWSPWHVDGGTTETPPYDLLEPRFAASILYNGAKWKKRTIEAFEGGKDGWTKPGTDKVNGKTTTGYYLRKLVDESHTDLVTLKSSQPWIAIRLAELYLNRAEALYRLNDPAGASKDLSAIRERVGLPAVTLSGEALWNQIRKERKLELAFEGQLFWDMRRWKLAHTEYSGTQAMVHGLRITKEGAACRYTYINADESKRYFSEKYYQIPIPEDELSNNKAIQQYTIWR